LIVDQRPESDHAGSGEDGDGVQGGDVRGAYAGGDSADTRR
jgi:hypothetical protein